MASTIRQETSVGVSYLIQLSPGENELRPKISLGKVTKRQAETAKVNIESLLRGKDGSGLTPMVQQWLASITPGLRKRLETLGIIDQQTKKRSYTVEQWVKQYIVNHSAGVKPRTINRLTNAANKLSAFFKDQYLEDVTVQQAKNYRTYLKSVGKLSENTIRRQIGQCRQFFSAAVNSELIKKDPFRGQAVTVRANPAKFYYIQPETACKVLDACPDAQWRLIFGLARWGGLRCPSEVLRLKWEDVDFEHERFIVHASKTEHHADSGIRTVPLFPELRPLFQDAFDNAQDGSVYCITQYRDGSNLCPQMRRIVKRSGVDVWQKIFQNLRSTRETELFRLTNGNVKAVCSWIGNSPAVAMQHYAQITESDMAEAAKMSLINDAEKMVQNTVQTVTVKTSKDMQDLKKEQFLSSSNCSNLQQLSDTYNKRHKVSKYARQDLNLRPPV